MKPYRASRPANLSQRLVGQIDWGVYDARLGKIVTESIYTEAFAKILASAMNYAFQQGREHRE